MEKVEKTTINLSGGCFISHQEKRKSVALFPGVTYIGSSKAAVPLPIMHIAWLLGQVADWDRKLH